MSAEFEAGLPGTGPVPVHLHTGQPTPWSEGCVVRFNVGSDDEWIANLQTGYAYSTKLIDWHDANATIVIAEGAAYFVRTDSPDDWRYLDVLGIDCIVVESGEIAILATYTDVVALLSDGREKWRRRVACDGVEIRSIDNGLIHGAAGIDPPDEWHPFTLQLDSGNDA